MGKKAIEKFRKSTFYCPICQTEVIVRAGPKVIPHFAHRSVVKCLAKGGEGAYHEQGKLILYNWLQQQGYHVNLEYYLPDIKQRPDLFVQIGKKKIAIEFQCVALSTKEIMKRNAGYHRLRITPIWILGANLYKRKANDVLVIPPYQQSFMHQFSKTKSTFLFYFCPTKKIFNIIYTPYFHKKHEAVVTQRFIPLLHINFTQLFQESPINKQGLRSLWKREKKRFRLQAHQTYGVERKWQYWLYEKGWTRQALPSIVYVPIRSQWRMKAPLWQWQSYFLLEYLHDLPVHAKFSYWEAEEVLAHLMYDEALFPLILQPSKPLEEYLQLLCDANLIKKCRDESYEKIREIEFYHHIEDAIIGDNELLSQFMYN